MLSQNGRTVTSTGCGCHPVFQGKGSTLGLYSLRRRRLMGIGIPMINLRRSDGCLRFIMGIPILIRRCLLSEERPWITPASEWSSIPILKMVGRSSIPSTSPTTVSCFKDTGQSNGFIISTFPVANEEISNRVCPIITEYSTANSGLTSTKTRSWQHNLHFRVNKCTYIQVAHARNNVVIH